MYRRRRRFADLLVAPPTPPQHLPDDDHHHQHQRIFVPRVRLVVVDGDIRRDVGVRHDPKPVLRFRLRGRQRRRTNGQAGHDVLGGLPEHNHREVNNKHTNYDSTRFYGAHLFPPAQNSNISKRKTQQLYNYEEDASDHYNNRKKVSCPAHRCDKQQAEGKEKTKTSKNIDSSGRQGDFSVAPAQNALRLTNRRRNRFGRKPDIV